MKITEKSKDNVYYRARLIAAERDDRLASRASAAEMIGVSEYTLRDYELGIARAVPVEIVVIMSELYNAPELKNGYCKYECPIGKQMALATEVRSLEGITLRLLKEFDPDKIRALQHKLIDITEDGKVSVDEVPEMERILDTLDDLAEVISEMKLAGEKVMGESK